MMSNHWFVILILTFHATGKRGLYTGTSGLKIAYVSGIESETGKYSDCTFTSNDVESVKNISAKGNQKFRGVDILISSSWPKDITFGQKCRVCIFHIY